jgi:hypothetical protein
MGRTSKVAGTRFETLHDDSSQVVIKKSIV